MVRVLWLGLGLGARARLKAFETGIICDSGSSFVVLVELRRSLHARSRTQTDSQARTHRARARDDTHTPAGALPLIASAAQLLERAAALPRENHAMGPPATRGQAGGQRTAARAVGACRCRVERGSFGWVGRDKLSPSPPRDRPGFAALMRHGHGQKLDHAEQPRGPH